MSSTFEHSAWLVVLCAGFAVLGPDLQAQAALDPLQVTATRGAPPVQDLPVGAQVFDSAQLEEFPAITLDDTLREDASFSLFRRTGSLLSNPTSQGVSLREIGPSGASRTLVSLNGVPLNDPFGGWVLWDSAARLSLRSAEIVQGGGSGLWGNQALSGAIDLTDDPFAAAHLAALQIDAGAFDTKSAEALAVAQQGSSSVAFDARLFSTDGVYDLLPQNRGAVDRPLSSHHEMARVTARQTLSPAVQAQVSASLFQEERNNGTALTHNGTRLATVSATLDGTGGAGFAWSAIAYAEREAFDALFTSVAANRATETPSDDQFAVPATAVGAAFTGAWSSQGGVNTTVGADVRQVAGETREDYDYVTGRFLKLRYAGGTEDFAGLFAHQDRPLLPGWRLDLDLRVDDWALRDGHDWEYVEPGGGAGSLTVYPRQSGAQVSPNAGVVADLAPGWRWRTAAYRGFRVPTLNEYYRPYRVGNVSTLANPDLKPESLVGAESGLEYAAGGLHASLTGFADGLDDAVGTVVVSSTPSLMTVERANLNSVRVLGAEGRLAWDVSPAFTLRAGWLYNDSRILQANAQPGLEGLRLQEVPRHTVTAEGLWRGPVGWRAEARLRWTSMEFDDPANTLRLPAAAVADLELSRTFARWIEVYAALENALNASVMTSLTTTGLATYDAPRMLRGGVRCRW